MSYDDDRRDYYRDLDRRAEYNREENRRYDNFVEDSKFERERRARGTEEGMEAIREGNLAWGAHKLGMTDFAIDYLQSQSSRDAEAQASSDAQVTALNQLASLGAAEQPDVLQILHDPSLSAHDRVFMAAMTMIARLDAEIALQAQDLFGFQSDINNSYGASERARLDYMRERRNELMATLRQLTEEQNERVRRIFNSSGME